MKWNETIELLLMAILALILIIAYVEARRHWRAMEWLDRKLDTQFLRIEGILALLELRTRRPEDANTEFVWPPPVTNDRSK